MASLGKPALPGRVIGEPKAGRFDQPPEQEFSE